MLLLPPLLLLSLLPESAGAWERELVRFGTGTGPKLVANDGAAGDLFGYSVAIDGDTAVVGAWWDDDSGSDAGSAYAFERQENGHWKQTFKFDVADGAAANYFGTSVAVDAVTGTVLIGAYGDDDNGRTSGAAYVFTKKGGAGAWEQAAKLGLEDGTAGDRFGYSVSLDGDFALIGAYGVGGAGAAFIFSKQADGSWTQTATLDSPDSSEKDQFGCSVALQRGTAIVGADMHDGAAKNAGAAYVFELNEDSGEWAQTGKLEADDIQESDFLGKSVAIEGSTVIVGGYGDDGKGSLAGAAYAFVRGEDGAWAQTYEFLASDGASDDRFGKSVAMHSGLAIIGAYRAGPDGTDVGAAYVFEEEEDGGWREVRKLVPHDGSTDAQFGTAVALSAGTALVGADRDDAVDNDSGAAYAFSVPAGTAASCPDGGDTCPTKPPSSGSGDDGKAGSGDALTEWLSALKMDQFEAPLRDEFGAAEPDDLSLLDDEDFDSVGMKKIHKRKLRKALEALGQR